MKKIEWVYNGKKTYQIKVLNATKIKINEEEIELKTLNLKNLLFVMTEYKLPIPEKEVLLSVSNGKYHLIVDGKDIDTNKEYVKIESIPKWIYIFIILNAINFVNGAVGICFAILSMTLTLKVCTENMKTISKLILCTMITISSLLAVFLIAIFLNKLMY